MQLNTFSAYNSVAMIDIIGLAGIKVCKTRNWPKGHFIFKLNGFFERKHKNNSEFNAVVPCLRG